MVGRLFDLMIPRKCLQLHFGEASMVSQRCFVRFPLLFCLSFFWSSGRNCLLLVPSFVLIFVFPGNVSSFVLQGC